MTLTLRECMVIYKLREQKMPFRCSNTKEGQTPPQKSKGFFMITAQIKMTPKQEQKLESAILVLVHREVKKKNSRDIDSYRVKEIEI